MTTTAGSSPEQRTNMLLAFSGALNRSQLGVGLDKQRVSATLGSILERPAADNTCSLQPLHDVLTRDMAVAADDAAGVLVWVKNNEGRYGVSTTLPASLAALNADQRAAALSRFAVRRDDGAYARGATGSFSAPMHLRETSGSALKAPREVSSPNARAPAASSSSSSSTLTTKPGLALGAMLGTLAITFVLANVVGLGANEAGWNVSAMWALRHVLLLAFGVVVAAGLSTKGAGAGIAAMFADAGKDVVVVAAALVGGAIAGAAAQIVLPSARDQSFVLGVVLAIAVVHVFAERFAWFALQRGLGERGTTNAVVVSVVLQVLAVFTFASVLKGGAFTWMGYAFLTVAMPTALLNRNHSIWPGIAWHLAFMLTTVFMA